MILLKTLLMILVPTSPVWANDTVYYTGVATIKGQIAYIEKHTTEYDDQGRLLTALTEYSSEKGVPIAELKSDFRASLTVPEHTVKDFRTGNVQGLRRAAGKVILFDQDRGQSERTRVLNEADAENRVLVGCQGLNYYLLGNLEKMKPDETLPLRFLFPGKLDYYDFKMEKAREPTPGVIEFEISIQNWFLKLFAPKLIVRYDKKLKHIVWYQGLSNIKNDHGENQSVTITYNYENK